MYVKIGRASSAIASTVLRPEKITDFRREGVRMPHDLPTIPWRNVPHGPKERVRAAEA